MTPFAHRIMKELLRRKIKNLTDDQRAVLEVIRRAHFFEITKIRQLATDLAMKFIEDYRDTDKFSGGRLAFLPAPVTWLESNFFDPEVPRQLAVILVQSDHKAEEGFEFCTVSMIGKDAGNPEIRAEVLGSVELKCQGLPRFCVEGNDKRDEEEMNVRRFDIYALLALINSPHIIGRQQHMPHAGMQRRLTAAFGPGKFPLHAWTEIKLEVGKPAEIDDGEPHEARLTGRRALHFCRAHIRFRFGRLEYVTSHWRGDPAIGIRRSRYRVEVAA